MSGYQSAPAEKAVLLTKANVDLTAQPRGLLVGTAGTANLMFPDGSTGANVPLQQGYNPIRVRQLQTGGTATDIWGLY